MTPIVSEIEEQKENIDLFGDNLTEVGVYSASFSPGFNYYLLNYEGPGVPWQKILSTSECMFFFLFYFFCFFFFFLLINYYFCYLLLFIYLFFKIYLILKLIIIINIYIYIYIYSKII